MKAAVALLLLLLLLLLCDGHYGELLKMLKVIPVWKSYSRSNLISEEI